MSAQVVWLKRDAEALKSCSQFSHLSSDFLREYGTGIHSCGSPHLVCCYLLIDAISYAFF